jgi:polyisoprenoid-binding protein YceI
MSSATAPVAATTRWEIDPAHSGVHFSVRHMMFANVRGEFGRVTGSVELDPVDLTRSSVRATIDAASISTRESQRDQHLRSADFLDVAQFPTIEFRSTRIAPRGGEALAITGDLTIHGVTREITLITETDGAERRDPFGILRRGATATTTLNRTEFGLTWNAALETGGILVGDELKVTLDVQLVRATDRE